MRLSLSVNGRKATLASLQTKGWLSAHVNLSQGLQEENDRVWVNAIDVSDEPNSTHSTWNATPLAIGDSIEIQVLADGESDPPAEISRTSESPKNLCADTKTAQRLLEAIKVCDTELWRIIELAQATEPSEESRKLAKAIGSVLAELDSQLISPTLRRHPDLLSYATKQSLR